MFTRSKLGERRLSPRVYKAVLTTHVIISGGWLGVVIAKLALGLAAVTATAPAVAAVRYDAMQLLNVAFPPMAIGTIVTGVILSLGTKWGLLRHYWVATKLVLTVAVIATAAQLGDRLVDQSIASSSGQTVGGTLLGIISAPTLLIALSVVHVLMLGMATVVSVYKPWGKTWFGRRAAALQPRRGPQGEDRRPPTPSTESAATTSSLSASR